MTGQQLLTDEKYLEKPLERLAGDEGIEAARVEAERAENVWQRSEDFSGGRDILHEERVQHHVGQAVVLKRGQERRLLCKRSPCCNAKHFVKLSGLRHKTFMPYQ